MSTTQVARQNPPGRKPTHGARQFERRYVQRELDGRESETKLLDREKHDLLAERGGLARCQCLDCREVRASGDSPGEPVGSRRDDPRGNAVSAAEFILLERAAFKSVLCQMVEAHVLRQPTPIQDGALLPVLGKQYLAWSNSLRRDLEALGLKPDRPDKVPSLGEYLAGHATAASTPAAVSAQPEASPVPNDAADANGGPQR